MIGRIRTIKPEFFTHYLLWHLEEVTGLPKIGKWYSGLWTQTDREERFEWKPVELKAAIAPYDAVDFALVLNAYANAGFVVRYRAGPRLYGWIPRFLVHQHINAREQASRLPPPPRSAAAWHENLLLTIDFGSLSREQLFADPPTLESVLPPRQDNDLRAGSRVTDASATRAPPVGHEGSVLFSSVPSRSVTEHVDPPPVSAAGGNGVHADEPPPPSALVIGDDALPAQALPALRGKATADALQARFSAVLAEVAQGHRVRIRREQMRQLQAEFAFAYWAAKTGHASAVLDARRRTFLEDRLRENNGDVNELLFAVDGALKDDWLMGRTKESTKKYDGINTIYRDREQVERLARLSGYPERKQEHAMLAKYRELLAASVQEGGGD